MKCPFKLLKAPYDGGAKCDEECAWLVEVPVGDDEKKVCAMTLVGSYDIPRKAINAAEE